METFLQISSTAVKISDISDFTISESKDGKQNSISFSVVGHAVLNTVALDRPVTHEYVLKVLDHAVQSKFIVVSWWDAEASYLSNMMTIELGRKPRARRAAQTS